MTRSFDCAIIGAGLSGLIQAIILAEEGLRVCLLEQHHLPGGHLQTFIRNGQRFDTGFHYLGSTSIDHPFGKYLRYLGIFSRLPLEYYPADCFYQVISPRGIFQLPGNFNAFIARLQQHFPGDTRAIAELAGLCRQLGSVLTFNDSLFTGLPRYSLQQWLDSKIGDPWLRELLAAFSFQLGVTSREAPFWKYLLCLFAIFDHPAWLRGGGDGLIQPLYERAINCGVQVCLRTRVTRLHVEGRKVTQLTTGDGDCLRARTVIATLHPKRVVAMLNAPALSPSLHDRVMTLQESPGMFAVYLSLQRSPIGLNPINYLCIPSDSSNGYSWFYFNPISLLEQEEDQPRIGAFCLIDPAPFLAFRSSKPGNRPEAYLRLKKQYCNALIDDLTRIVPDLEGNIVQAYASTPLTDEYFTGTSDGSAFGIRHNLDQQGLHRVQPRMRIQNLFFSGQSIHLPGICGVTANAFYTASKIIGPGLFDKVAAVKS